MKSLALPSLLLAGSVAAMTIGQLTEEPPTAPTNLRALPAKILRIDWNRNHIEGADTNWPQVVYETTNLTNWTETAILPGTTRRWETNINRFESHRFFTIINAPDTNQP